ncbi:MAG: PQQ-binding-like beta-propeller repeat protein [Planctomycetota bacterium]|nr:PQQ-binding-like beta-propeller repeat protein [Planctomycetota bacterium]
MLTPMLLAAPALLSAPLQDWPHWNGAERNGKSSESAWSDAGQIAWTVDVGVGYSSVAVVGDRLFTLGHDAEAQVDQVLCLNAASGEELWRHTFAADIMANFHTGGTLTTPTVAGNRVFLTTREGKGFCLDAVSGEVLWSKDYKTDLELKSTMYGYSASPLADEGELFLLLGGTLLRVDPANGEILRRGEEDWGDGGYANPLPLELRGRSCLVIFAGPGLLVIDRESFEELQRYPWKGQSGGVHAGTPILLEGDRVLISSAYGAGAALLHLGEAAEPELLWRTRALRNKVDGAIVLDEHLYGFDESLLKCFDLAGEELWRVRGLGMGAIGAAGDRLMILSSKGELIIAEASAEEFRELSRQQVLHQEEGVCWTFPVLVRGRIYCRGSEGDLVCVDHRAAVTAATSATQATPESEWPSPTTLFARHAEVTGRGADLAGATLEGALEVTGAGITRCPMTLRWSAPNRWAQSYDLGSFGKVERTHDGEIAWILDPFYGDRLLEGELLREWSDTKTFPLDDADPDAYAAYRTAGQVLFADRPAWAVAVVSRRGARRTLYFDREAGHYLGRDGADEHLVRLAGYTDFDGVQLPTLITQIAPETGEEERWFVTSATWERPDDGVYARPEKVQRMLRSPEEVAAANAEVDAKYGAYYGTFGDPEALSYVAKADDGAFTLAAGSRGFALAPIEGATGSFSFRDMPAIRVVFDRDEAGDVVGLTLSGGPIEEPQVLPKVK